MQYSNYLIKPFRMDDDPEEEQPSKEEKTPDAGMLMKKMEKYFFETRSVYLWGDVQDKSAAISVTKLLLLDADKPGEEIKFYINSPGGVVTSGMVIYDTMKMLKSPVSTICMGLAGFNGFNTIEWGCKRSQVHLSTWRSDDSPT
jgi:ATP-dependent Clp protease protease subunit